MHVDMGDIEAARKKLRRFSALVALGLVGAALLKELGRAPSERTWHGRVLGFVPYDFRIPTPERVRSEFWNPSSDDILSPHAFGVGWGINFGGIARRLGLNV